MANNTFVSLPAPAGNGAGAAADVSAQGAQKTITVGSSGGVYEPVITIEASNDGVSWAPIVTFNGPNETNVIVACKFMRQNVSRFFDGTNPSASVGALTLPVTLTTLAVPAGSGNGAASVSTGLQTLKSIQVGGPFKGTLNIDISNDGGVTFETVASFSAPGFLSEVFTADHIRVARVGVPVVSPGQPTVIIADNPTSGGGGGGGNAQVFRYTAQPGDGTSIVIGAPQGFNARPNNKYNAMVTLGDVVDGTWVAAPPSLYQTTQFTLVLGAAPTAGDTFLFLVEDLS